MAGKIEITIKGMEITTKVAGVKGRKCLDIVKFLTENKNQKTTIVSQELTNEHRDGPKILADTISG